MPKIIAQTHLLLIENRVKLNRVSNYSFICESKIIYPFKIKNSIQISRSNQYNGTNILKRLIFFNNKTNLNVYMDEIKQIVSLNDAEVCAVYKKEKKK